MGSLFKPYSGNLICPNVRGLGEVDIFDTPVEREQIKRVLREVLISCYPMGPGA